MAGQLDPICIEQPAWLGDLVDFQQPYPELEHRMGLAIDLSAHNMEHGGGPFGACVFNMDDHTLISVGVNLVTTAGLSVAHAEMLALMQAQRRFQSWTLGADNLPGCELVTSSEPCVQCFGGIYWSGVKRLVCGAGKSDVEAIGFDEGPRPEDWVTALGQRGIDVQCEIMRDQAKVVLQRYQASAKAIYNPL